MVDDEDWSTISTRGKPDLEQNSLRFSSELSVPYLDVTCMFRPNILVIKFTCLLYLNDKDDS
jgi:hypothetical protein